MATHLAAEAEHPTPAPPPFEPDVELIDNAEGNDRLRREDREAAEEYLKRASA